MKIANQALAVPAALALSLSVAAFPAPDGTVPMAPPVPEGTLHPDDRVRPYAHTAIGAVIEANGGQIPATGTELTAALAKLGDFVQLPVPFSAVALNSGLKNPRVIITLRPSTSTIPAARPVSGGASRVRPSALGHAAANAPYLEGRLFLAANTGPDRHSQPVVKTIEFISWNSRRNQFDFGVIEDMGAEPKLKILDGTRCFSCHKNKGPILGADPWSNTAHNGLVRSISAPLFQFAPLRDRNGKENERLGRRDEIDGLKLLTPNGPDVDTAVRRGAEVPHDRERFKLLVRTANGQKALVMLLSAVTSRGALNALDQKLKTEINQLDLTPFLQAAHAANKTFAPSLLADFDPVRRALLTGASGLTGSVASFDQQRFADRYNWTPQLTKEAKDRIRTLNPIVRYDQLRAGGESMLPSEHQPSNPKAFVRPALVRPAHPSLVISAVQLARAIGLSEGDREFLATSLEEAMEKVNGSDTSPAALAKVVFNGPSFADVLEGGVLPERDDFKDRFVAGLVEEVRRRSGTAEFWHARERYATAPRFATLATEPEPPAPLPSHACAACHDFRTGPKPSAFSPIPVLAFDPFEPTARENWLRTATRKQKQDVLGRLLKRMDRDKDMPPEDSVEAELYRVKDATAMNAVKGWLDAELKRA